MPSENFGSNLGLLKNPYAIGSLKKWTHGSPIRGLRCDSYAGLSKEQDLREPIYVYIHIFTDSKEYQTYKDGFEKFPDKH